MTGDTAELVRYRLARATETLDEARLLLEHGKLYGCVNRSSPGSLLTRYRAQFITG